MMRTLCNLWMVTAKLIPILVVCVEMFEIPRHFTNYLEYIGLSSIVRLRKWSLLGLIYYNLDGYIT